ncbi:DUF262 domain-containing HNH endonuclease family protein [uncultured Herbaspirillum sp.]|uniref:DUF262 domain-containing protein n=1 Tax=uncultured Herbaspirillum sp. TaxID=160236 RepID=UPI00258F7A5D|nr:DUF262 domain-containing HNH endonuclease family protein [uncultured Herbaspirillum sp.]
MNLQPDTATLMTVADLLSQRLVIPAFQRPYDWRNEKGRGRAQVSDFVYDIEDARHKKQPLFLGMIVACQDASGALQIVDGQQRLTTLMLALGAAGKGGDVIDHAVFPVRSWIKIKDDDRIFFEKLVAGRQPDEPNTLSQRLLADAFAELKTRNLDAEQLLQCRLIVYLAPTIAGATSLFERINLRGKEVSQFDLVKNKLIEWAASCEGSQQEELVQRITQRYGDLYRLLDPESVSRDQEYDSDRLLRIHWILFDNHPFSSSDRVLEKIDERIRERLENNQVATYISEYLDDLVQVCGVWLKVEDPISNPEAHPDLRDALLDFVKVPSDAELQPLVIAALIRLKGDAVKVIRMAEITAFRTALADKRSNYARSRKWRMAKEFKQGVYVDDVGGKVDTADKLNHQMYWAFCPYWEASESDVMGAGTLSKEEREATIFPLNSLDSPSFYRSYARLIHYIFWNYGRYLPKSDKWAEQTKSDMNPLDHEAWFSDEPGQFGTWDIEHIYPVNSADKSTPTGRKYAASMAPYLHHLGNLTVLPVSENRSWKNANFDEKLPKLQGAVRVSFNALLSDSKYIGNRMASSGQHWGENNCRKRAADIKEYASLQWGTAAVKALGVGCYDERVGLELELDDDDDAEDK